MELWTQRLIIPDALIEWESGPFIGEFGALNRNKDVALRLICGPKIVNIDPAPTDGAVIIDQQFDFFALQLADIEAHRLHGGIHCEIGRTHPLLAIDDQSHSQQVVIGATTNTEGNIGFFDGKLFGDETASSRVTAHGSRTARFTIVFFKGSNPILALNIVRVFPLCARRYLVALGGLDGHRIAFGRPISQRSFFEVAIVE